MGTAAMDETQGWKGRLERVKDLYAMYVEAICWRVEHPEGLPTTHPKRCEQPSLSRQQLSLLGIEDADKFVCTAWQHEFGGKGAVSGANALPQWAVELLPHVIWFEDRGGGDVVLDTVEKPDGETFRNVEVVYFHWHEADIIKAIVTVLEELFGAGQPLLCKGIRCSDDAWTRIDAASVLTDYFTASVRAWGIDVREGFLKTQSDVGRPALPPLTQKQVKILKILYKAAHIETHSAICGKVPCEPKTLKGYLDELHKWGLTARPKEQQCGVTPQGEVITDRGAAVVDEIIRRQNS